MQLLIDAMFEKKCNKDDEIIVQEDNGDYFYVIESGTYEVWKSDDRKNPSVNSRKVFQYNNKGAFGELALMYNAPRAATVRAITNGVLWAVDRHTFRHIIVGCTARKRNKYDKFLQDVQLLMDSSDELRAQIADVLETVCYKKGDYVFKEGDDAEHFYFVQRGEAVVTLGPKHCVVRELKRGDFFGERALMMNDQRSANVLVMSEKMEIAGMDNASFMRLLCGFYHSFRARFQKYKFAEMNAQNNGDDGDLSDMDQDM